KLKALKQIGALVPIVTLGVGIAGAIIALGRLKEAEQTRNLMAVLDRFKQMGSSKSVEARRLVYTAYTANPWSFKHSFAFRDNPQLRKAVNCVIADLGELGILIDKRLCAPEFAWIRLGTVPIRTRFILDTFLISREDQAGNPPPVAFARLAESSLKAWRAHTKTHEGKPITRIITIYNQADST